VGFSRLPLLWRVFGINASLLVLATLLLVLARGRVHASLAFLEGIDVAVGLAVMLVANFLLLRQTLRPVERLVVRMRTVDLLRPGQRLVERGGIEVVELVRVFNQMLERLEAERRESGRRALRAQEAERSRIARGLHDEVGEVLTGVLLQHSERPKQLFNAPEPPPDAARLPRPCFGYASATGDRVGIPIHERSRKRLLFLPAVPSPSKSGS